MEVGIRVGVAVGEGDAVAVGILVGSVESVTGVGEGPGDEQATSQTGMSMAERRIRIERDARVIGKTNLSKTCSFLTLQFAFTHNSSADPGFVLRQCFDDSARADDKHLKRRDLFDESEHSSNLVLHPTGNIGSV